MRDVKVDLHYAYHFRFLAARGFMAMSTVLIITAVVLLIATTVAMMGISEVQSSYALFQGEGNLALVEGCLEDYLLKIRADKNFSGGNIVRPEGVCAITIVSADPNWEIIVSSVNTLHQRRIRAVFMRNTSGVMLSSWKEL